MFDMTVAAAQWLFYFVMCREISLTQTEKVFEIPMGKT